jgi:hypothetical protein
VKHEVSPFSSRLVAYKDVNDVERLPQSEILDETFCGPRR